MTVILYPSQIDNTLVYGKGVISRGQVLIPRYADGVSGYSGGVQGISRNLSRINSDGTVTTLASGDVADISKASLQNIAITTSAAHGLATGDIVSITGGDFPSAKGMYQITVTGTDTFTLNRTTQFPGTGDSYTSGAKWAKPGRFITTENYTSTTEGPNYAHVQDVSLHGGVTFGAAGLYSPTGPEQGVVDVAGAIDIKGGHCTVQDSLVEYWKGAGIRVSSNATIIGYTGAWVHGNLIQHVYRGIVCEKVDSEISHNKITNCRDEGILLQNAAIDCNHNNCYGMARAIVLQDGSGPAEFTENTFSDAWFGLVIGAGNNGTRINGGVAIHNFVTSIEARSQVHINNPRISVRPSSDAWPAAQATEGNQIVGVDLRRDNVGLADGSTFLNGKIELDNYTSAGWDNLRGSIGIRLQCDRVTINGVHLVGTGDVTGAINQIGLLITDYDSNGWFPRGINIKVKTHNFLASGAYGVHIRGLGLPPNGGRNVIEVDSVHGAPLKIEANIANQSYNYIYLNGTHITQSTAYP